MLEIIDSTQISPGILHNNNASLDENGSIIID